MSTMIRVESWKKRYLPPHYKSSTDYYFGNAVGFPSKLINVGDQENTVKGNKGAGEVYTFNIKNYKYEKTFTSPNSQYGGNFGVSVAGIGASGLMVGADGEGNSTFGEYGNAYIYS